MYSFLCAAELCCHHVIMKEHVCTSFNTKNMGPLFSLVYYELILHTLYWGQKYVRIKCVLICH